MVYATRACGRLAALIAAIGIVGCGPKHVTGGANEPAGLKRTTVETLTVQCSKVIEGQRSWMELAIEVEGRHEPLRMPVLFKQGGRPVDIPDDQALELIDRWMEQRASEIAIFGTIGMSFGQQSPAVTIDVDQRAGGTP